MDISLKNLDTPTMIALSTSWLAKGALAAIPEASGLVARVRAVHDELVVAKPAAPAEPSAELTAIVRAEAVADNGHDYALRAFLQLLEASRCWALSEEPPDEERAASFAKLSAELVPGGPATTQQTYQAESGSAAQAAQRLANDAASQKLVGSMRLTTKVTGSDIFDRYVEKGAELGKLEKEKKAAETAAGATAVPATLLKARNAWIKIGGAVAAVLEQSEGDAAAALLVELVDAADKARQRIARSSKKGSGPAPGGGAPGGGAPGGGATGGGATGGGPAGTTGGPGGSQLPPGTGTT